MFLASLAVVLAGIGGLALLYARKNQTFPGYRGDGQSWWLPIVVFGGTVLALWGLAAVIGISNPFTEFETSLRFGAAYDDALMKAGAWILGLATTALAGIAAFNLVRHGKAVM